MNHGKIFVYVENRNAPSCYQVSYSWDCSYGFTKRKSTSIIKKTYPIKQLRTWIVNGLVCYQTLYELCENTVSADSLPMIKRQINQLTYDDKGYLQSHHELVCDKSWRVHLHLKS